MSGLDRAYLAMMYYWVSFGDAPVAYHGDAPVAYQKPCRDAFSEKVSKISSVQEKMENRGKSIT